MIVTQYRGRTTLTVRGPETKATPAHSSMVGAEWVGIAFKHGTVLTNLPASTLVDGQVDLPGASSRAFWLNGAAWQFPDFGNADAFVARLAREGLLVSDPIAEAALQDRPPALSPRSVQRHVLQATGLTQGAIWQIERARRATLLLQGGNSILDTVDLAGYADQPHLTRALKRLIGKTPADILRKTEPEQMSLLFKTEPLT
jgi:hypothetical protein